MWWMFLCSFTEEKQNMTFSFVFAWYLGCAARNRWMCVSTVIAVAK